MQQIIHLVKLQNSIHSNEAILVQSEDLKIFSKIKILKLYLKENQHPKQLRNLNFCIQCL